MLILDYGGRFVTTHVQKIARYAHRLQRGFGTMVAATAIAMYFQYDVLVVAWLTGVFPSIHFGA